MATFKRSIKSWVIIIGPSFLSIRVDSIQRLIRLDIPHILSSICFSPPLRTPPPSLLPLAGAPWWLQTLLSHTQPNLPPRVQPAIHTHSREANSHQSAYAKTPEIFIVFLQLCKGWGDHHLALAPNFFLKALYERKHHRWLTCFLMSWGQQLSSTILSTLLCEHREEWHSGRAYFKLGTILLVEDVLLLDPACHVMTQHAKHRHLWERTACRRQSWS